jgi:hypothetical protein
VDDITLTNSTTGVQKGALSGGGTSWTLNIYGITAEGPETVSIDKPGIESAPRTGIDIYKNNTAPSGNDTSLSALYAEYNSTHYSPVGGIVDGRTDYTIVVPPPSLTSSISAQVFATAADAPGATLTFTSPEIVASGARPASPATYRPNDEVTFEVESADNSVTTPYNVTIVWAQPIDTAAKLRDIKTSTATRGDDYFITAPLELGSWEPICSYVAVLYTNAFTGSLRGMGHTITIDGFPNDVNNKGIFEMTNGAFIEGIRVHLNGVSSSASGAIDAGAIASIAKDTTFKRIEASGSLTVSNDILMEIHAGGIAGEIFGSTSISDSNSSVNVSGASTGASKVYSGGIAGLLTAGTITRSSASGTVTSSVGGTVTLLTSNSFAGGIVGNMKNGIVTYCAAQNPSVTGGTSVSSILTGSLVASINRIVGKKDSGDTNHNDARSDMTITGTTSGSSGHTSLNGEGVNDLNLKTQAIYLGTTNDYNLNWDFDGLSADALNGKPIWKMPGTGYPILNHPILNW